MVAKDADLARDYVVEELVVSERKDATLIIDTQPLIMGEPVFEELVLTEYSDAQFSIALADGVIVAGAALIYRMRSYDSGLSRVVYWSALSIDTAETEYIDEAIGPGPLVGTVVSNVICQ